MGKKGKVKHAHTKEGRKQLRATLGSLKSLTVQPQTRIRYKEGLDRFFNYLRTEGLVLPKKRDAMDDLVGDYLEFLWSEGEGREVASNFLAALQDFDPKLRGALPASWRLMKTWTTHEVPNRAPPLTEPILKAMCGWGVFHKEYSFCISLLVAFHGLLRTGELLAIQGHQIHLISPLKPAVLSLGLTKSGKRQGAAESVTITDCSVLKVLWRWKKQHGDYSYFTSKPHVWRETFNPCLHSLGLQEWGFRPYSLRRGGATALFVKTGSLDRVLMAGRWTAIKTAKIYLNSGLAMLADLKINPKLLTPFNSVFVNFLKVPPKLEPALEKSRAGGRGKKTKVLKKTLKKGGAGGSFRFFFHFKDAWGPVSLGLARIWQAF